MLAPGYYHMECQTKEDCTKKNPKSFCHMFMCVDCLKENVACTQNGQCCDGTECIYGRCKKGAKKDPGNHDYLFMSLQSCLVIGYKDIGYNLVRFAQVVQNIIKPRLA